MKISLAWLKELVPAHTPVGEIAHALTMGGLEVEEIAPVAGEFSGIVVGLVKGVAPHPNADKLRVTEVDAGTGEILTIVCGAPNVAAGQKVPCALIGAKLPGLEIKKAKLRGVESSGMLCSARELGLSDDHGGLLVLDADAPIGQLLGPFELIEVLRCVVVDGGPENAAQVHSAVRSSNSWTSLNRG